MHADVSIVQSEASISTRFGQRSAIILRSRRRFLDINRKEHNLQLLTSVHQRFPASSDVQSHDGRSNKGDEGVDGFRLEISPRNVQGEENLKARHHRGESGEAEAFAHRQIQRLYLLVLGNFAANVVVDGNELEAELFQRATSAQQSHELICLNRRHAEIEILQLRPIILDGKVRLENWALNFCLRQSQDDEAAADDCSYCTASNHFISEIHSNPERFILHDSTKAFVDERDPIEGFFGKKRKNVKENLVREELEGVR